MIHILHISDLHFVKNAASYNTEEILLREAARKVKNVPQGEKLLIITGDFHNFWDSDYKKAESFLLRLVASMELDITQDVFVIPGNHDVGNDTTLEPLLLPMDKHWKSHQKSCLTMLKNGDKSYIEERLQKFRPYSEFVQHLGIYDASTDEDLPARSHVRSWRNKLNILHLNTALIADGTNKDDQMTDADTAADPKTWEPYYNATIPSIAIGHCNFYDINKDQRADLAGMFSLRNVSVYLCGDRHQTEWDPEYKTIPIQPEVKFDIRIPNLVAAKTIADGDDNFSEVGFCWHYWDEVSDEVSVEFRKWTRHSRGKTEPDGEGRRYDMRHKKSVNPTPKGNQHTDPTVPGSTESEDKDTDLRNYLSEVLKQKRNNHPSFQLMTVDEIDSRLYPNIKEYSPIDPRGKVPAGSIGSSGDSCPIWEIIRNSWSAPDHRSIVILGEGGIGKTVALFRIAESPDGPIPVPALYIPMYELVDKDGQLLELDEYLIKRYRKYSNSIDSLATKSWNDQPQLLILLDGFNEIPFSLRRGALDVINEWHDSHPGTQLIAVSRPMDGLNLTQELVGNPLSIELSPLQENTVREYLKKVKRQIPANGSPIWEDLRYPLFLNLYVKSRNLTKNLPAGYPLSIMDVDRGGSLIWNFLQRELLRHRSDKSEKAENWVLRCAVANEYILPFLAYRMLSEHKMDINYKQASIWIKEALDQFDGNNFPHHLTKIWDKYEQNHGQAPEKDMFSFEIWRNTILRDSGILVPLIKQNDFTEVMDGNYVFMHQHFRDCLAGLYLVNQAEMSRDNDLPSTWRRGQNYLALDYAAELMDENTADRLWEINRKSQQYDSPGYEKNPSGTYVLLELQKRRMPLQKAIDFSGMDIQDLSLTHYLGHDGDNLSLFQKPHLSIKTKMNSTTFQSEGHVSSINCMLILPDGRVVSGSNDNSLRVWDTSDGRCLMTLKGHSGCVTCMAVLPDGRVISSSEDHSLRVWDTSDGCCLMTLKGHSGCVTCMAVLPDGRVVSSSEDRSLRVWDTSDGRCLMTLKGHSGRVSCMAVLPDGRVVSGSEDRSLRVWDTSDGRCLMTMLGHSGGVSCMAVLPDGRVASGSEDRSLRVWDTSDGRCLMTLKGHSSGVSCMAVLPDRRIVSGSFDCSLRVWDTSDGRCLMTLKRHFGGVSCVAVLPDGRVISGSYDNYLQVWSPSDGRCLMTLAGHSGWISCVTVLLDGRIVSGSFDCSLRVWDTSDGRCLMTLKRHFGGVSCVAVLPDGRVVSGSEDRSLRIWDTSDGRCLMTLKRHSGGVSCVAVLPDGRVVSGSEDRSLQVWDTSDGRCLMTMDGHSDEITCMAVLPDGRVVSGSYDRSLRVWDTSDGRCLMTMLGHSGGVSCMAVLPDGRVVSGSYDGSLRVWDTSAGRCLMTMKGHPRGDSCMAALPDGRVVSGSYDGSLRVWDTSDGRCLMYLMGHSSLVGYVLVLPDGRVVSGSYDGSLRVWDTSDGRCLQTMQGHSDLVSGVAVLPDGRVVSGSGDGTIKLWDLNIGEYIESMENTEIDVSRMDLSRAVLSKELAKLLWQNGAKISKADYERYVRPSHKEEV